MARIIENEAGFKVIEVSRTELVEKLAPFGSVGICDYCSKSPEVGYYIAVLDQWFCPECYQRFTAENTPHKEDKWFEDERFSVYRKVFGV